MKRSAEGDVRSAGIRRYVMPLRPFTIAMRVQHVGRYGSSAPTIRGCCRLSGWCRT